MDGFKKINCPKCGKELVRLEPFTHGLSGFWCDDCGIEVSIASVHIVHIEDCDGNRIVYSRVDGDDLF